jgi:hypothetical protein
MEEIDSPDQEYIDTQAPSPKIRKRMYNKINPTHDNMDGNCSMCAFNSYLALKGFKPKDAGLAGSHKFKVFGDWFFKNFTYYDTDDGEYKVNPTLILTSVNNGDDLDKDNFKRKTTEAILSVTKPGEPVLLCVDYATHWYTAYNQNNKIIYVDSQTNKGFNVYSKREDVYPDTNIDIINIPDRIIHEYLNSIHLYAYGEAYGRKRKTKRKPKRKTKRKTKRRKNK